MFSIDPMRAQGGEARTLAPEMLDFALPDALRRARHAALLPLMASLHQRGWVEADFLLLQALVQAGEVLRQGEAGARAGLSARAVGAHIKHLIADGYIEYVAPQTYRFPQIVARDIGRRQIGHIAREIAKAGARDWAALAALPDEVRITERMRARLFTLLDRFTRVCTGADESPGANAPAGLPEPGDLVAVTLPLQTRRARAALLRCIGPVLQRFDFTEAQWRVLRILDWQPGLSWTRRGIERRGCFHFSDPVVGRALFTLSQRGLIVKGDEDVRPLPYRTQRWGPRKRYRAAIGRRGRDIIRRIEAKERIYCADLFARLSPREMWQLHALLTRVTEALLWQEGVAPDEQTTHPFAQHYARFDAYVHAAGRTFGREMRQRKQAGVPVRSRRILHWWE